MGKVAKTVQKVVVDIPARLWQLGLDYLDAKKVRDGGAERMDTLKKEGLALLEKAGNLFMQFPNPDGSGIKVQRVPTVRSTWDVGGLLKFLQARIGKDLKEEQVKAVFKVTVDEDNLKTLLDAGLVELKAMQKYCRTEQGYSFRVDRIKSRPEQ